MEGACQPKESRARSIVKAISYRLTSIVIDTIVAFIFTKKLSLSLAIVLVVNAYSTFVYYAHERVWNKLTFGLVPVSKEKPIDTETPQS
jgi:uncharacterized membrane protein